MKTATANTNGTATERDAESYKQVYEEELRKMRVELEDYYIVNNRLGIENMNLESKLKDFISKFEDIKKTNEELLTELNEAKAKKNRLEFEVEDMKLQLEKPVRENKQLKKDLEDLITKFNEKQLM
jgi:hypothetical protein